MVRALAESFQASEDTIRKCLAKTAKTHNLTSEKAGQWVFESRTKWMSLLPQELLLQIMFQMDYPTLMLFCATSTTIRNVCEDEGFWKSKVIRDFGKARVKEYVGNYQKLYRKLHRKVIHPYFSLIIKDNNPYLAALGTPEVLCQGISKDKEKPKEAFRKMALESGGVMGIDEEVITKKNVDDIFEYGFFISDSWDSYNIVMNRVKPPKLGQPIWVMVGVTAGLPDDRGDESSLDWRLEIFPSKKEMKKWVLDGHMEELLPKMKTGTYLGIDVKIFVRELLEDKYKRSPTEEEVERFLISEEIPVYETEYYDDFEKDFTSPFEVASFILQEPRVFLSRGIEYDMIYTFKTVFKNLPETVCQKAMCKFDIGSKKDYRKWLFSHHPDSFPEDEEKRAEAERIWKEYFLTLRDCSEKGEYCF